MIKKTAKLLALGAFVLSALTVSAQEVMLTNENTKLSWTGRKVLGEHYGDIKVKEGKINWDGTNVSGGEVVVDMTTITCTDLDGEYGQKLVGHLKSEDFFGVEKHKTALFKINSLKQEKGTQYTAEGELTIKGQTHPISFPVHLIRGKGSVKLYGTAKVDRSKYDIKYGSTSFFDDLGDKAIDDVFDLKFEITANTGS